MANDDAPLIDLVRPGVAEGSRLLCTSWDPFHRIDLACTRAVRSVAAAQELFDLARAVDSLFGVGEGRLIARAAASASGSHLMQTRAPGGTRKVVYVSGVPSNLIRNFQMYVSGLHARLAWRAAGHSAQSLGGLAEVGRRLSSIEFVAFLVMFNDILQQVIRPYALLIQKAVEPSVGHWAGQRLLLKLRNMSESVLTLRSLLTSPQLAWPRCLLPFRLEHLWA